MWSLAAAGYSGGGSYHDPYAALRTGKQLTPDEIKRQMQEQQLKARQLVLQQQASSAVAAASKTQREVCPLAASHPGWMWPRQLDWIMLIHSPAAPAARDKTDSFC